MKKLNLIALLGIFCLIVACGKKYDLNAKQVLVVNVYSEIKAVEELDGRTVGVMKGSAGEVYCKNNNISNIAFENEESLEENIKNEQIIGMIVDEDYAVSFINRGVDGEVDTLEITGDDFAMLPIN